MALPLIVARSLALRAVRASGRDREDVSGAVGKIQFRFSLAQGGKGLRRWADKGKKNVQTAAYRATNKTGRWGRTQIKREVAKLLNISQKSLRSKEYRSSSRRRPVYRYTIFRREYHIRELRSVRFHAYKGGGGAGKLRYRAYGKRIVLDRVVKRPGSKGDKYLLLPKTTTGRPSRVMGPWVKKDYRAPRRFKREIPKRFRREFRRQIKMLGKRGR